MDSRVVCVGINRWEEAMKKTTGFVLVLIAMALMFTSAVSAIPPHVPGPNDNQLICHQTQHHQLKKGEANANQKGVIINVDPSAIAKNPHIKHGDACIEPINEDPRAVAACAKTEPFPSAAACTGESECPPPGPGNPFGEDDAQRELCCAQSPSSWPDACEGG
jgi:hypothetical protein